MNHDQRRRRNARFGNLALRIVVWAVLVIFVLTSVGVALVNFTGR